jgi:hypothetical protein
MVNGKGHAAREGHQDAPNSSEIMDKIQEDWIEMARKTTVERRCAVARCYRRDGSNRLMEDGRSRKD